MGAHDRGVEFEPPCGWWQVAHFVSSTCAIPRRWFAPVTNSMSSWQEPQAAPRWDTCTSRGALAAGPSWHFVQLRMSCGKTTVEKSETAVAVPMI